MKSVDVVLSRAGIVSALGLGVEETRRRMAAGDVSGMKKLEGLSDGDTTYFGHVPIENVPGLPRAGLLLDAAMEQLSDVLEKLRSRIAPGRIAAVVGTSNSTMEEFTYDPVRVDMSYPSRRLKERWGVGGPAWTVSTACSSSAKVFSSARSLISGGLADVVIVGGVDAMTHSVIEGFHALEALSPESTRPLAQDRSGINLGEGAAFFVMCRVGELGDETGCVRFLGAGETSDAYHLTAPDPEGRGAEAAMRAALDDACLRPEEVGYINLHGTGTTYNDSMECAAIRRVFGPAVPCSSTKPLTGHCLGAAGAIEAALTAIALADGSFLPPHCIIGEVDAGIAPFPIPRVGNSMRAQIALSNSFAFGGSNAAVILGRLEMLPVCKCCQFQCCQ